MPCSQRYGALVETRVARSCPSMPGALRARSTNACPEAPLESMIPCCAPALRRTRTSLRVSTPSIPMTPLRSRNWGSDCCERQFDGSLHTRRAIRPATCAVSACSSPAWMP